MFFSSITANNPSIHPCTSLPQAYQNDHLFGSSGTEILFRFSHSDHIGAIHQRHIGMMYGLWLHSDFFVLCGRRLRAPGPASKRKDPALAALEILSPLLC